MTAVFRGATPCLQTNLCITNRKSKAFFEIETLDKKHILLYNIGAKSTEYRSKGYFCLYGIALLSAPFCEFDKMQIPSEKWC